MRGSLPFACIQSYVAMGSGGGRWEAETDPGLCGIDQSIADDPRNARAIRCYEKAGFRAVGEVQTPDGVALLMVCERK